MRKFFVKNENISGNHRDRQLRLQGRENGGQILGGCDKINVLGPLLDQLLEHRPELLRVHRCADSLPGNGPVLAVDAPQRAAAEEYRAAPSVGRQHLLSYGDAVRYIYYALSGLYFSRRDAEERRDILIEN